MADREPVCVHRVLGLGAAQTRSEGGDERNAVDLDAAYSAQIQRDQALVGAAASTPPTTLVPPPNGTTAIPSSAQISSTSASWAGLLGHDHRVGRRGQAPAAKANQVGVTASRRSPHALLVGDQDACLVHRVDDRTGAGAAPGARPRRARPIIGRPRLARAQHLQRRRRQRHPLRRPPGPLRRPRGPLRGLKHPRHPPTPARCPRAPRRGVAERRRIIVEPSRESPRRRSSLVSVTRVASASGSSPISSLDALRMRSNGVPATSCSHAYRIPWEEPVQRKSARTPVPRWVPSTAVQCASPSRVAHVLDAPRPGPPAGQVVRIGDQIPHLSRLGGDRPGSRDARHRVRTLFGGRLEASEVAHQQQVLEMTADRGETLEVLDGLLASRLAARAKLGAEQLLEQPPRGPPTCGRRADCARRRRTSTARRRRERSRGRFRRRRVARRAGPG